MSYQVQCPVCENQYALQTKPDVGSSVKCYICKHIWSIEEAQIVEITQTTSQDNQTRYAAHKQALIVFSGLFILGLVLWQITSMYPSFMVLNSQIVSRNTDKFVTCNILNKSTRQKTIKSVKVNFEDQSIEYTVNRKIDGKAIFNFESQIYPENAILKTIKVNE